MPTDRAGSTAKKSGSYGPRSEKGLPWKTLNSLNEACRKAFNLYTAYNINGLYSEKQRVLVLPPIPTRSRPRPQSPRRNGLSQLCSSLSPAPSLFRFHREAAPRRAVGRLEAADRRRGLFPNTLVCPTGSRSVGRSVEAGSSNLASGSRANEGRSGEL